jgi:hypothetical protein
MSNMSDRTRREYLRDLGITTVGINIAGCLEGDEDPTSTPEDTVTSGQDTPTEEETPTDEESATETGSGDSIASLGWVPSPQVYSRGAIEAMGVAYPSQIMDTVSDSDAENYEEEGFFVPEWMNVSSDQMVQYGHVRFEDATGMRMNELSGYDITQEEDLEAVDEQKGYQILRGEGVGEGGLDVLAATDGDGSVAWTRYDFSSDSEYDEEEVIEMLGGLIDAKNGDSVRFMSSRSGQRFANIEHEDIFNAGSVGEDEYSARRVGFNEDNLTIERLNVGQGGSTTVESEEEYQNDEYRGLNW